MEIQQWIDACFESPSGDVAGRVVSTCHEIGARAVRSDPEVAPLANQLLAIPSRVRSCPSYLREAFAREQLMLLRGAAVRHPVLEPAPPPDRPRRERSRTVAVDREVSGEWITIGTRFTELAHEGVHTRRTLIEVWLVPAGSAPDHLQRTLLLLEMQNTSRDARPDPVRVPGERFIGTIGFRATPGTDGAVHRAAHRLRRGIAARGIPRHP